MTQCSNVIDEEHGTPCGDEGRLCDVCQDAHYQEYAWMARCRPQTRQQDEQDIRDAGRGHLLPV